MPLTATQSDDIETKAEEFGLRTIVLVRPVGQGIVPERFQVIGNLEVGWDRLGFSFAPLVLFTKFEELVNGRFINPGAFNFRGVTLQVLAVEDGITAIVGIVDTYVWQKALLKISLLVHPRVVSTAELHTGGIEILATCLDDRTRRQFAFG